MIYSAVISYLSCYNKSYRDQSKADFIQILSSESINTSDSLSFSNMLNDPAILNSWLKAELPNDDFSVDNAVIMMKSDRYTLAIDPNMQASNFIRKKLEVELQVPGRNNKPVRLSNNVSISDSELKNLKLALKVGGVVIMENFAEPVNP